MSLPVPQDRVEKIARDVHDIISPDYENMYGKLAIVALDQSNQFGIQGSLDAVNGHFANNREKLDQLKTFKEAWDGLTNAVRRFDRLDFDTKGDMYRAMDAINVTADSMLKAMQPFKLRSGLYSLSGLSDLRTDPDEDINELAKAVALVVKTHAPEIPAAKKGWLRG